MFITGSKDVNKFRVFSKCCQNSLQRYVKHLSISRNKDNCHILMRPIVLSGLQDFVVVVVVLNRLQYYLVYSGHGYFSVP